MRGRILRVVRLLLHERAERRLPCRQPAYVLPEVGPLDNGRIGLIV